MRYHIKVQAWQLSGNVDISDEAGNPVFHVQGKFLSAGDDLTLVDRRSGQKLAHIKQQVLSLSPKYQLYTGNDQPWATVSQGFGLLGERFKVKGPNGSVFQIKGNVSDRQFTISDQTGRQWGEVGHRLSFFRDSYAIDVPPGVDPTFIVALAVILERIHQKRKVAKSIVSG